MNPTGDPTKIIICAILYLGAAAADFIKCMFDKPNADFTYGVDTYYVE